MKNINSAMFWGMGLCLITSGSFAQSGFVCPTKIGYSSTYLCSPPVQNPGFYMTFNYPYTGSGNVQTNFGSSDPNCQPNMYLSHGPSSCGNYWLMDFATPTNPVCTIENPTGTVAFSNGTVCHYEDGLFTYATSQECENLLTDCKDPLLSFAKHFVPDPPDCKLWEGPCATEGEIWRDGVVSIGTAYITLKMTVKGGITTEMLQLCVPEWCDYVFSDTFDLMPLNEVAAFIQTNHHLPGCTSGKTIDEEGGFFLDRETVHQQEKIEEIFLHLIAAQKRLDNLDEKIPTWETGRNVGLAQATKPSLPFESITDLRTAEAPAVAIECFQIKPAQTGASNGIGGVAITPGGGPFNLTWAGGQMNGVVCEGTIKIPNLAAGNYTVTVSNSSGTLGACSLAIGTGTQVSCGLFDDPACKKAIIDMLSEEGFSTPPACVQWEGNPCTHNGNIYRLGNVGIGTSVMRAGYSLAVKGGITTDKFRIELCGSNGWCDYVFDKNYPLLTLYEVERYIREHKHLPGTVSQNEVTQNGGFEMRSVKLDQQEKIEEAYLYLIQLNKQKEELHKRLTALYEQN